VSAIVCSTILQISKTRLCGVDVRRGRIWLSGTTNCDSASESKSEILRLGRARDHIVAQGDSLKPHEWLTAPRRTGLKSETSGSRFRRLELEILRRVAVRIEAEKEVRLRADVVPRVAFPGSGSALCKESKAASLTPRPFSQEPSSNL
jgi:hypothetical protein